MTEDNLEQGTQADDGGQPESTQNLVDSTSQTPGPDQQGVGQSDDSGQDNPQDGTQADTIVFDPREFDRLKSELPGDVKGQLEAFMKNIQGDYTRKNQALSETRRKVEAYNAFESDPRGTITQLAQQMGFKLVPADSTGQDAQSDQYQGWTPDKGNPESWKDVTAYLGSMVEGLMKKHVGSNMAPVFQQLQEYRKNTIESRLNDIDPSWRQYEESMMSNLSKYPAMANDVELLYRASVPSEVLESRATQKAQARMQNKIKSSQVSGGSTTRTKAEEQNISSKPRSFEEAYQLAKDTLAKQGIVKTSAR
jgi:hypothetical protein